MRKFFSFLTAILFAGSMMAADPAAAGTTLFSENFGGYAANDVPSGSVSSLEGSRVVYGDASVTYTSADNGKNITKIYTEALASGTSPELLVGKSGGVFTVAGIPSGNAKEITVSFKQNAQKLTVSLAGNGYSTEYASPKPAAAGQITFDVTVADEADATFSIIMTPGSSNVRVDDILVTVKTAGEASQGGGDTDPDPDTKTIYLNGGGSSLWNQGNPEFFVHSWGGDADGDVHMTLVEGDVYKADIPADNTDLLFLRLATGTTEIVWSGEAHWNQSANQTIPEGKDLFTLTSWDNGTWSVYGEGGDPVVEEPAVIKLHGNFSDGTNWADTENFAVAEGNETASLTLNLAAGNYEFGMRIGADDNWTSNGAAFTRENNSAVIEAGQGNITLDADAAGEYTFTWTYATNTLTVTYPEYVEPTYNFADGYYLIGLDMADWNMENMPAEGRLFAANPDNEGEYQLTITLAADQQFKVVSVQKDQIKNWYPDGMDNNYIVDAAHAGEKTVYFRPDGQGGQDWHYGCIYVAANEAPVVVELQAVSEATTWDFSKITANTGNALYNKEGIQLTDESTPSKNDEMVYANYSADFMTFAEGFDAATMAFKGEYPIRKNQYCQAGTLRFKTTVAGTITVKFSDTGSSASATAVKRYLVVNGEQTEYWTSRQNNGTEPYDAQLNVTSGEIAVPAGDVTITGSSAIVVSNVTFTPEAPAKFYVTGNAALVGQDKEWNPSAIKSEADTLELNLEAGVDYILKVAVNGTWEGENNVKGYNELTEKTAGLLDLGDDHNIGFKLNEAGIVKVIYKAAAEEQPEVFKLIGNFYIAPIKYYIAGSMSKWEEEMVELLPLEEKADSLGIAINLEADSLYAFKVVRVQGTDTAWYGLGEAATMEYGNSEGWWIYKSEGDNNQANVGLMTTKAAAYPFVVKVADGHMEVSVVIPEPEAKLPVVGLGANFNDWNWPENLFVPAEDSLSASFKITLGVTDTIEFKIVSDGKWLSLYGENGKYLIHRDWNHADHVNATGEVPNFAFNADAEGEYIFTWTYADSTLVVTFPEKETRLADGYYLIGSAYNWTVDNVTADLKFEPNPGAEGEYMLSTTVAEDDYIKVVKVENDAAKTWFPEDEQGAYHVDAEHAGPVIIYFRPDYQGAQDWHYNCFTVIKDSSTALDEIIAAGKAVKIVRNGQILIIKGEKIFNAQGQLVK